MARNVLLEQVSDEEFLGRLVKKLGEKAAECQANPVLEELADMAEVIRAVVRCMGCTWEELEQVRDKKAEERGAFETRLVLKEVRG